MLILTADTCLQWLLDFFTFVFLVHFCFASILGGNLSETIPLLDFFPLFTCEMRT